MLMRSRGKISVALLLTYIFAMALNAFVTLTCDCASCHTRIPHSCKCESCALLEHNPSLTQHCECTHSHEAPTEIALAVDGERESKVVKIIVAELPRALAESLDDAFNYAENVVIERAITSLREINCSVVGDSRGAKASECEEPVGSDEILSFNDKYVAGAKGGAKSGGAKGSAGMASLKRKIPAPISDEMREYIRETAKKAFLALGCSGVSRIDFLLDGETGEVFFNEINTIPGSLSFYLWEPLGVKYPELLDELISLALAGYRRKSSLTYSFKSSVLQSADFSGTKGAKGSKM